jgi:hypothetical protein
VYLEAIDAIYSWFQSQHYANAHNVPLKLTDTDTYGVGSNDLAIDRVSVHVGFDIRGHFAHNI